MPAAKTGTTTTRSRTTKVEASKSHPLDHLIPKHTRATEYVSRTVYGVHDIDLLRYAKAARKGVLLFGPTGPGKTSLVEAYAATDKLPLVVIECRDGIDPATFFGQWLPNPDPSGPKFIWQDSDIVQVIRHGGVLLLDECNFMRPKVAATFHRLLRDRTMAVLENGNEVIEAHSDLQIVAAYNPGYEGTFGLNAAFKNRFAIKCEWKYDPVVEAQLVGMPVLLEIAGKLRDRMADGDIETPVSTNMLTEFEEFSIDLGLEFAVDNFIAAFTDEERAAVREVMALSVDTLSEQLAEMERLAEEDS